jgi:6-phosphogluconolactonase (cycloisomerase 2 family)
MRHAALLVLVAAVAALAGAQAAYPDHGHGQGRGHGRSHGHGHGNGHGHKRGGSVVWVQTNEVSGNKIVVFDRAGDGSLSQAGVYATGGNGGVAAPGSESDHLATQGSLVYDSGHSVLIAVNAGSDTVTTFKVHGDRLQGRKVVSSGGQFPASIAVHGRLVYVLNAGGPGIAQGFWLRGHHLRPITGSARSLGLANGNPPNFLTSPGQVGFTPNGHKLLVTTKASGSNIDVFRVRRDGTLSAAPVVNASATPVPFAFTFTPLGRLASGEAGASSLTTYELNGDGTLSDPRSATDGQMALCWIVRAGGFYYVSNTGSNNLSSFTVGADGTPSLLAAVAAPTDAGPIDLTVSGRYLYAQTGTAGTIDGFRINGDGSLTSIGSVTGLPVGQEGIASN